MKDLNVTINLAESTLRGKLSAKHGPDFFRFFETSVRLASNSKWGGYREAYLLDTTGRLDERIEYEYDCLMNHISDGLHVARWKIVEV